MKIKLEGKNFEKYTPPGLDFLKQLKLCLTGLSAAVGWSISYIAKYLTARSNLYEWSLTGQVLRPNEKIEEFGTLLHEGTLDSLDGFLVFYIVMIGVLVYHYWSYYQGSKSIYLMKRLPDRWELHRRSIALPFAAVLTGIVTEIAIVLLYYGIYLVFTPEQCLPF